MAQAIEARVPFLGMSHAKLANQLPLSWRLSNDDEKMALRAAADLTSLPKKIMERFFKIVSHRGYYPKHQKY